VGLGERINQRNGIFGMEIEGLMSSGSLGERGKAD